MQNITPFYTNESLVGLMPLFKSRLRLDSHFFIGLTPHLANTTLYLNLHHNMTAISNFKEMKFHARRVYSKPIPNTEFLLVQYFRYRVPLAHYLTDNFEIQHIKKKRKEKKEKKYTSQ